MAQRSLRCHQDIQNQAINSEWSSFASHWWVVTQIRKHQSRAFIFVWDAAAKHTSHCMMFSLLQSVICFQTFPPGRILLSDASCFSSTTKKHLTKHGHACNHSSTYLWQDSPQGAKQRDVCKSEVNAFTFVKRSSLRYQKSCEMRQ